MTREEKEVKLRMILTDYHRRDDYELRRAVNDILALDALPPAEGAEEIRVEYSEESLGFFRSFIRARKELCAISPTETYSLEEAIRKAFDGFAALHAQKIADKMVSERDDDVFDKMNCLVGYLERWWKNPQSYPPVELKSVINEAIEYLKSREK